MTKEQLIDTLVRIEGTLLSSIDNKVNAPLRHVDAILLTLLTGVSANKLCKEDLLNKTTKIKERIIQGDNYLPASSEAGTLLGQADYVLLQGGGNQVDTTALILHHLDYLIAPYREVNGTSVMQKVMNLPDTIRNRVLNTCSGSIPLSSAMIGKDIPVTKIKNLDQLTELVGDDEDFIIYTNNIALIAYLDENKEGVFKEYDRATGVMTDTSGSELSFYIGIE